MESKGFYQFEIIINVSALSDLFEYLCYGSTAIINMFTLTSKVGPRTVRVKHVQHIEWSYTWLSRFSFYLYLCIYLL